MYVHIGQGSMRMRHCTVDTLYVSEKHEAKCVYKEHNVRYVCTCMISLSTSSSLEVIQDS